MGNLRSIKTPQEMNRSTSLTPEVIDLSKMSKAMAVYYTRKAKELAGRVKYVDAWGLSVKALKDKCVDGWVWQESTGRRSEQNSHFTLI